MNLRFARGYKAFLINAKLWRANLERVFLRGGSGGANLRETLLRSACWTGRRWARGAGVRERDGRELFGSGICAMRTCRTERENAVLSKRKGVRA